MKSEEKKTSLKGQEIEVENRLFQVRPQIGGQGFSRIKAENSEIHWKIVSRENEILRAAGFTT